MRTPCRLHAGVPLLVLFLLSCLPIACRAFCGFYVARGDAKIFNRASKVVIARDGTRTVVTMSSDFQGRPEEFAVVIPVPVVPKRSQVHVGNPDWVTHLDEFSAPRLVEHTDPNPCPPREAVASLRGIAVKGDMKLSINRKSSSTVRVQAQFKVDEYEIVILSAEEGRGLEDWLRGHQYTIPEGASAVLESYIRQGMYFFLAKVDPEEMRRRGSNFLRPIQVAYDSPKFMLPIRLGMVNAAGLQELFVITLTQRGRVETVNYRTVRMPTDLDVPEFVKGDFGSFYRRLFDRQVERAGGAGVFLEYAWAVEPQRPTCDPCTGPLLKPEEMRALGAFWITEGPGPHGRAILTRLHVRYDRKRFPEDLVLQETRDATNWQARYVLHHPYPGPADCPEIAGYWRGVWDRRRSEARNYADLTGTALDAVREKMVASGAYWEPEGEGEWWTKLWK